MERLVREDRLDGVLDLTTTELADELAGGVFSAGAERLRAAFGQGAAKARGAFSDVLDALTADPKVWARTALFITYDENDGFYDHVVPAYPTAGNSTVDLKDEFLPASAGHVAGLDRGEPGHHR